MSIHVILVSQEPLANGIPVLMERPKAVVGVCTQMAVSKGWDQSLLRFFGRKGLDFHREENAPDSDLSVVRSWALELLGRIERDYPDTEIVLNLTGGNKIMSLGFWEIFKNRASKIIYTDTAHDRIEILAAKDSTSPTISMDSLLNVPDYLSMQGIDYLEAKSDNVEWREKAKSRFVITRFFGKRAHDLKGFFGTLNGMVGANGGTFHYTPGNVWEQALRMIVKAGLARWSPGEKDISFTNVEAARYLGGGWLEEYAYIEASQRGFYDVRANVRVQAVSEGATVSNELDIVIAHRNRLFILECKTGNLDENKKSATKPAETLYKLEVLRQKMGGRFSGAFLVMAQDEGQGAKDRAKNMGAILLGPQELQKIGDRLTSVLERSS